MSDNAHNNTPMDFSQNDIKKIQDMITKLQQQSSFFQTILDTADKSTIQTHLSLMQYSIRDLCEITGVSLEDIQNVELLKTRIKELSTQIQELSQENIRHISGELFSQTMRQIENIFITWYEAIGFNYASLEYSNYGIRANFSYDMSHYEQHLCNDKQLFVDFSNRFPSLKTINEFTQIKEPGSTRMRILDNDKNKEIIEQIVMNTFPNARIYGFSSRYDCKQRIMKTEIYVPYTDILNLIQTT